MAIIGKQPFVNKIINSLTTAQVSTLAGLVNNLGTPTEVYLYGNQNVISNSNKGVSYVRFHLDEGINLVVLGILCYKDNTHCGLFVLDENDFNGIQEVEINPTNKTYKYINEHLTSEELRRCIGEQAGGGSEIDPEVLATVVSGSLGINADLNEAGTKVDVHPDMTGASDGYVWTARTVTPAGGTAHLEAKWENASSGGGTQLYKHQVLFYATCKTEISGQEVTTDPAWFELYIYTNSATPFTATTIKELQYSQYVSFNGRVVNNLSTEPLLYFMSTMCDQGNSIGYGVYLYNDQPSFINNLTIDNIITTERQFEDNVTAL